MAVFAFHNTHALHQLSFFNGESTSSATPPPKRAVNSCGIENILEITDVCGSGNLIVNDVNSFRLTLGKRA